MRRLSLCLGVVLALVIGAPGVRGAMDDGLVGYWTFDEGTISGTVVADSSGKGNDGVAFGNPTPAPGKVGTGALTFGLSKYVIIDRVADDVAGDNDITLNGWVRTTTVGTENTDWLSCNTASKGNRILLGVAGNTDGGKFIINDGATGQREILSANPVNDDRWHMLTYVKHGPTDALYVDGVEQGTHTVQYGAFQAEDLWSIGQEWDAGGTGNYFSDPALVDEVAIWTRALSTAEILKVYQGGAGISLFRLCPSAFGPTPADQEAEVPRDVVLGWTAGASAAAHDVYLGTSRADVNSASRTDPRNLLVRQGQEATTADVGRLEFGQTYYWRIDEVNAPPDATVFQGDIWSFTTEPLAYPVDGRTIKVTASSAEAGQGPENTINGSGLTADLHSIDPTAMWLTAVGAAGPAWIQYEFEQTLCLDRLWVWNQNGNLEAVLGLGAKEVTLAYSTNGVDYQTLGTTRELARAPGAPGYACNTTVDLEGIAAKYVKLTILSNWGGILQQYGLSEVRFFSVPVLAREPSPASGATGVGADASLSWRSGRGAARHQVCLGTDRQAVVDGTAPAVTVSQNQYTAPLDLDTTYYWKVVEVNEAQTPAAWPGEVWSFSTKLYLVVDDFESYTDDEGQAIFQTWADGLESPAHGGSQVGNDPPPYAEGTIVHSGRQSMPLAYDNSGSATYSEATRTFASPQDWSGHGIKGLTLRFYGNPANAAQQMYAKVNGTKVLYDGAPDSLLRPQWQMWYIDLTALDVRNVTKLSIGFDRLAVIGGRGKVFLDDLRLYPRERSLTTPVDPGTAGLQAQYAFEGNFDDGSGQGRKGSARGAPVFVAGKLGQAVSLDGYDDYVNIDGYKGILGSAAFSIAAWIKSPSTGDSTMVCWGSSTNGRRVDFRLAAGRLRVEHGNGNLQGNTVLADDEWHHVALTVAEGTSISYPGVKLYLDGKDDSQTTTDPDKFNTAASADVTLGRRGTHNDRSFLGLMDEVRVYDRVLSPEEITSLAGRTMPFDKPF